MLVIIEEAGELRRQRRVLVRDSPGQQPRSAAAGDQRMGVAFQVFEKDMLGQA